MKDNLTGALGIVVKVVRAGKGEPVHLRRCRRPLQRAGYNVTTASPQLSIAVRRRLLKRIGPGYYASR